MLKSDGLISRAALSCPGGVLAADGEPGERRLGVSEGQFGERFFVLAFVFLAGADAREAAWWAG